MVGFRMVGGHHTLSLGSSLGRSLSLSRLGSSLGFSLSGSGGSSG